MNGRKSENVAKIKAKNLISSEQLAQFFSEDSSKYLIVDCRRFFAYNTSRVQNSINICCSKLILRRMHENKISATDYLLNQWLGSEYEQLLKQSQVAASLSVILYGETKLTPPADQSNCDRSSTPPPASASENNDQLQQPKITKTCGPASQQPLDLALIEIFTNKLATCEIFDHVFVLKDGFLDFCTKYPQFCEGSDSADESSNNIRVTFGHHNDNNNNNNNSNSECLSPSQTASSIFGNIHGGGTGTCFSQPCQSILNQGPTKILPFVYLGSQQDSLNKDLLRKHGINYVLNMSVGCPKPEFLQEEHFLRIPVNDSNTEKLLPYFERAFQFLEKVRKANGIVLVHCLAGVSRSPTLAIAYVMNYLHMGQADAYKFVKEKRPNISPNFNFLGQLLEFENRLNSARLQQKLEQVQTQENRTSSSHHQNAGNAQPPSSNNLLQSQRSYPGGGGQDCSNYGENCSEFFVSSEVKNVYGKRKLLASKPFRPLIMTSQNNTPAAIGAGIESSTCYTAPVVHHHASPFKFPTMECNSTATMAPAVTATAACDLPSPGLGLSKLNVQQTTNPFALPLDIVAPSKNNGGNQKSVCFKTTTTKFGLVDKTNQSELVVHVKLTNDSNLSNSIEEFAAPGGMMYDSSIIATSQPNLNEQFYKFSGAKRRSWPRSLSRLGEIREKSEPECSTGTHSALSSSQFPGLVMNSAVSDFDLSATTGGAAIAGSGSSNPGSVYGSNSSLEIMVT